MRANQAANKNENENQNTHHAKTAESALPQERSHKIDPTAPAGSKNSLGAESVRDGRPSTDDSIVEAIDEEGPGIEESPGIEHLPTAEKPRSRQ